MKKLWHEFEKFLGIYRWHPKIALRYLPIVKKISEIAGQDASVLEIGSSGLGITPYLKRPVVGLDIDFSPPIHPLLTPVRGSALDIPFSNQSFDVVLSVDMLEHIKKENRNLAIYEMLRVAKVCVIIGVPCGKLASFQDELLQKVIQKSHTHAFQFLEEQVEYGLPEESEIISAIGEAGKKLNKKISIQVSDNLNLRLREFLMRGWISTNPISNIIFRKFFLLLIPLMRHMNNPPVYRKLFFVSLHA